jgi:hypothetical protein
MNGEPGGIEPIEVHLEDGGHVIVSFTDSASRLEASDMVAELLVLTSGSEGDLEHAIRSEASGRGLICSSSPNRHPTVIIVGRVTA